MDGYFECGCYDGYVLDGNNSCVPEVIDSCPGSCSHICYQGQCSCPDDMHLDPTDGATCRRNVEKADKKKKKKVDKVSILLIRFCRNLRTKLIWDDT
jgi:hypothetical protein